MPIGSLPFLSFDFCLGFSPDGEREPLPLFRVKELNSWCNSPKCAFGSFGSSTNT